MRLPILLNVLRRVAVLCVVAFCIGWVLHKIEAKLHSSGEPAGFVHGTLHGALMPLAMPNLLVGSDVTIYAEKIPGALTSSVTRWA